MLGGTRVAHHMYITLSRLHTFVLYAARMRVCDTRTLAAITENLSNLKRLFMYACVQLITLETLDEGDEYFVS